MLSEESVVTAVASASQVLGRIDILVHAAGSASSSPVVDLTLKEWNRVIAVDLTGVFLTTRAVLPGMVAQGFGRVIILGSQMAFAGAPTLSHYCAAKAGVNGFAKSVAREVAAHNVTVNVVAPGPTDTPGLRTLPEELVELVRAQVPLGRIADVDDIVPTVVMLASEGGAFYTGAVLSPCGGHVMP